MLERVVDIIREQADIDEDFEITPKTKLETDLGIDSLSAVEIVMALEDEFGIQIDDEDSSKFKTVNDLVKFIKENN